MEIWGEFRRYGLFKSNNAPGEFGRYARAKTRAISGVMSGKELKDPENIPKLFVQFVPK